MNNIVDGGKYYLYRWVREDKGDVFYVGIGSKHNRKYFLTHKSEYTRAYKMQSRNTHFMNIKDNYPCNLEIVMESNDYEFIKQKEVEFINTYGRYEFGGTLVNYTDGGEGTKGRVMSKNQILNMSGGNHHNSKRVIRLSDKKVFTSVREASVKCGISYDVAMNILNNRCINRVGIIFEKDYLSGLFNIISERKGDVKVINLNTKEVFNTLKSACINSGMKHGTFYAQVNNHAKNKSGYMLLSDYEKLNNKTK